MYEHVPVRNIVDLGSDEENFISRKILNDHGMDPAKIRQLPDNERRERTLDTVGAPFTPTEEVTLYWHRLKDATQRRARFLISESEAFDVIIGHKLWDTTEGFDSRCYLTIPGFQRRSTPNLPPHKPLGTSRLISA
jgi:hypothetical protein